MRFVAKLVALVLVVGGLGLLTGCQNVHERRGVSRLPHNRPADWENQPFRGVPR